MFVVISDAFSNLVINCQKNNSEILKTARDTFHHSTQTLIPHVKLEIIIKKTPTKQRSKNRNMINKIVHNVFHTVKLNQNWYSSGSSVKH